MSQRRPTQSNVTRGYAFGFLAALLLSTTGPFIRYLSQEFLVPPLVLAFWRDGLVVVTLLPVLAVFMPALLKGLVKVFQAAW